MFIALLEQINDEQMLTLFRSIAKKPDLMSRLMAAYMRAMSEEQRKEVPPTQEA